MSYTLAVRQHSDYASETAHSKYLNKQEYNYVTNTDDETHC